jgi:hypothetical protein
MNIYTRAVQMACRPKQGVARCYYHIKRGAAHTEAALGLEELQAINAARQTRAETQHVRKPRLHRNAVRT